jgi:hypothetical protein
MEALFKIERGNTGTFSTGGLYPHFTKKGKIWQGWAALKAHLRLFSHTKYAKSLDGVSKKFVLFKLPSYVVLSDLMVIRVDENLYNGHCDDWSRMPIKDFVQHYMKFDTPEVVEKYEESYVVPSWITTDTTCITGIVNGYSTGKSPICENITTSKTLVEEKVVETYDLNKSYALFISGNSTPLVICGDFKVLMDLQTFLHSYRGKTATLSAISGKVIVNEKNDVGTC